MTCVLTRVDAAVRLSASRQRPADGPPSASVTGPPYVSPARQVEIYFNQIRQIIKQYRVLVEKLGGMKSKKKKFALEIPDLLVRDAARGRAARSLRRAHAAPRRAAPSPRAQLERTTLKDAFIAKKLAARANITLLRDGLDVLKDRQLRELQDEYRELDNEFKELGLMSEKESLFDGAEKRKAARGGDGFDPSRAKNDDLLDKAKSVQASNLDKLKAGLSVVEATKEQAKYTAAQLEQDREKLKRIDAGLDEVQGELELSRILITRVVKALATDKIIIAFAFLLVVGIAGVIAYATLNPGQTTFNVPAVVTDAANAVFSPTGTQTPSVARRMMRG